MVYSNADDVIKYGVADMTPDDGERRSKITNNPRPGSTSHEARSGSKDIYRNSKAPTRNP